uniref:Uncharacterized protein n=1 Tax=Rhizophagus irregularis (strain DAOM 181602 / DAOM 197198 / MUCL 43194) TaxID=747089 RepID=U9U890_RHIID
MDMKFFQIFTEYINKYIMQSFIQSPDTRQDFWFTASSLHAILETLDSQPESVIIMSDNGSHYHNADLMMIMAFCWPKWYNVKVKNGHRLTPHTGKSKSIIYTLYMYGNGRSWSVIGQS